MDVFERVEKVANDLADDWNADFLYINSDIDDEAFDHIFHETEPRRGKGEYLFILLTTEAGSSSSAHKIMSYFKYKYLGICILALGQCRNAGKIMCEEALETWVGKASGLGPLDLQGLATCNLGEETAPVGNLQTFQRLSKGTDFFALHKAINALESCDFVTFREGGVSAFSRAIDHQTKDNSGLSEIVDMLPKESKIYAPGSERNIFYLNGYYC